jgi:hypothetical protein
MKLLLILSLLFFEVVLTYAQNELPAFGKIDKADLEMKDCDFDKGAIACKLIDWGNIYYERGQEGIGLFKLITERRVRIKILKDKGLSFANVTIPFYSYNNDTRITKIDGNSYNIDETGKIKITDVGKSSIYTKKINKRLSEVIIAFPEAKAGSVIEYKYKIESDWYYLIPDWYFQDRIPTLYSEFQLKIPLVVQFSVHPVVFSKPEVKEKITDEAFALNEGLLSVRTIKKNYILQKVPGIKEEPFMGSVKDYQQRLEFQLTRYDFGNGNSKDFNTNWGDVVKTLNEDADFGEQLNRDLPETSTFIDQVKIYQGDEERMKFIYQYLKKNFTWDNDQEIYAYQGLRKTWEKKTGSTGDINLLLVYLLNQAGIKTNPILLSTREHGLVNSGYPFIAQFNIVMAYVEANGHYFILDAADKNGHYKLIPQIVANTAGLIINNDKGKWKDLLDEHKYKLTVALRGEINKEGIMTGDCLVNSIDYAKFERSALWKKDQEKFKAMYFAGSDKIKAEELVVNNADADSLPLEQKLKFTQTLSSSGAYKYFTTNFFTTLDRNPFTDEERVTDIDFGYQKEFDIFGNFTLPDGYSFDELPKDITMVTPDKGISFSRTMLAEDNLLNVKINVAFNRNFYPADEYPDFKEFYKKMMEKLNEQIVIKKKVAS